MHNSVDSVLDWPRLSVDNRVAVNFLWSYYLYGQGCVFHWTWCKWRDCRTTNVELPHTEDDLYGRAHRADPATLITTCNYQNPINLIQQKSILERAKTECIWSLQHGARFCSLAPVSISQRHSWDAMEYLPHAGVTPSLWIKHEEMVVLGWWWLWIMGRET